MEITTKNFHITLLGNGDGHADLRSGDTSIVAALGYRYNFRSGPDLIGQAPCLHFRAWRFFIIRPHSRQSFHTGRLPFGPWPFHRFPLHADGVSWPYTEKFAVFHSVYFDIYCYFI